MASFLLYSARYVGWGAIGMYYFVPYLVGSFPAFRLSCSTDQRYLQLTNHWCVHLSHVLHNAVCNSKPVRSFLPGSVRLF